MKYRVFLIPVLLLCFWSSCITSKDTNLLQDIKKDYPLESAPVDYRIIPGDQLSLTVYTLDDNMKQLFSMFSQTSTIGRGTTGATSGGSQSNTGGGFNYLNVYSDGSIKIPYVGKVYVQDLTVLEAKRLIASRLSEFSANVTVDVILNNRYFSVLGEAGSSRVQMTAPRLNVYQALALSGSIKNTGNLKKVKIIRQTAGGTEVKTFDLRSKDIVDSEFYYIQPNDVLYVEQLQRKFIGATTNFLGVFGLITGFIGMVTVVVRLIKK